MKVSQAAKLWLEYHNVNSKKNTSRAYELTMSKFVPQFHDTHLNTLMSDEVLMFLNQSTEGKKQSTKKVYYSHLNSFFNFIKNNTDEKFKNPCDTPIFKKLFQGKAAINLNILEKDCVDEIIFRTISLRNRLMLELMARGGLRIGEVLKLIPNDVHDRKIIIREPKSGKEHEVAFIPQKVADRLRDYIVEKGFTPEEHLFPICYETAREMVSNAGKIVNIRLRPHDLRRHAATYASRSRVPLEIISKVILRHANLSTTQLYLGKVSDTEALKWIENIYG